MSRTLEWSFSARAETQAELLEAIEHAGAGNGDGETRPEVSTTAGPPWGTAQLPELVGAKETLEILEVDKMTLNRWSQPGSGDNPPEGTYMIPPARIRSGPVWVREDVERFKVERGRQRRKKQPPE